MVVGERPRWDSRRSWEERYRERWAWDRTAKVSHPQDCYPGNCSWVAYIRDGTILREEQTGEYPHYDPSVPDMNPAGCNKGCLYSSVTYGKERVLHPLRRKGRRGEGEWERISWDEALAGVADSILDAIRDPGPASIVFEETPGEGGMLPVAGGILLTSLLGGASLDTDGLISDFTTGMYMTFGKFQFSPALEEWFRSDLNLIWYMNPVYTRIPFYHWVTEQKYRGGELVTIAPDLSPSTVHADRYVPIRFGTDASLALGMCRVIVEEGLWDREFVSTQTDLPLLVRLDTRRFLREADLRNGGSQEKFHMWSEVENRPVDASRETLRLGLKPALEGTYEVVTKDGTRTKVSPVFHILKVKLKSEYTPEKVQAVTGLHPEVVRELARKVASKRTFILVGWSPCKVFHGDLHVRAMCLLQALTGNWGKPGTGVQSWSILVEPCVPGGLTTEAKGSMARVHPKVVRDLATFVYRDRVRPYKPTEEQVSQWTAMLFSRFLSGVPPVFFWYWHCGYDKVWDRAPLKAAGIPRTIGDYLQEAVQKGWWEGLTLPPKEVEPRVLLLCGSNTLRRTRGAQREYLAHLWPKLKMVATIDVRMSTTALYSDIVLPAAFFYEKSQLHSMTCLETRFWAFADKAIEPRGEAKPEWEIWLLLARKIEERAKQRGLREYSVPHGLTLERFAETLGARADLLRPFVPDEFMETLGPVRKFEGLAENFQQLLGGVELDADKVNALCVEHCKKKGVYGPDETLEKIRKRGFVKIEGMGESITGLNYAADIKPDRTLVALENHVKGFLPYPTLTKRAQFYIDHEWFLEADEELPVHKDRPQDGGDPGRYPFVMTSGHLRWSMHASTVANELMAQTHRGEPFLFINREDAAAKNIQDGERVRVFNDYGEFLVQAKVSSLPRPRQVIIYHAWDPYQFPGRRSYDAIIPGLIKPLHLAGGYGHLNYYMWNWQPQQVDRHVNVDIEPAAAGVRHRLPAGPRGDP